MRYYYFNPISKQYWFPEGFEKFPLFKSFYHPYKFSARILWYIWRNIGIIRRYFVEQQPGNILPEKCIRNFVSADDLLAYNLGSRGVEQKTTILGINPTTGGEFFIKYGETPVARKNVSNEANILSQLKDLDFVPHLLLYKFTSEYAFIKTTILKGDRFLIQLEDQQLITVLEKLGHINVESIIKFGTGLQVGFAHGDFCPWNMMKDIAGKILIYDWEMAGEYPLGFDLFTYIFQTSFLISNQKSIDQLLKMNESGIRNYFSRFNIEDWQPYLLAFAEIKFKIETEKQDNLASSYKLLRSHAEKI